MIQQEVVLLMKNSIFSTIGKVTGVEVEQVAGAVSTFDPRDGQGFRQTRFETVEGTDDAFKEAITTSKERGWTEVFRGTPLNYPVLS